MRLFIAIGGLLVLLLSAVLVAPLFVDWTSFRTEFEREASRILGQPVRVLGSADARLLPFPSVSFENVVVGEDGREPVMTLERFRMDAELAPYLSGEIRVFEMRLVRPHLRVPMDRGDAAVLPGLGGSANASTVVLERVVVEDGRIALVNEETGRSRDFGGIDAEFSAQSLAGPFAGTGALTASGERLSFTLSSGRIEADGRWPLRLALGSARLAADFVFDGVTSLGDSESDFSGRFDLRLRAGEDERGEGALPPVSVSSAIEISRREAMLTELRAEIGDPQEPYVLAGEGRLDIADIPHFDLTLRGEQVDVDDLAPEGERATAPRGFAERAEAVRATLAAIPPIGIPGRVDLALPVVTAGDTVIRDLRFSGSPSTQGWTLRDFTAELPGRTLVEAEGILTVRERLGFAGDVLVAVRQPPRFASWLTGEAAPPEVADLSRAGFSGRAFLSAETQRFEDLEVDVGGERLEGRIDRVLADGRGAAETLSADLAGGAADLDRFVAFAELFAGSGSNLRAEHFDVRLEAGPVEFRGLRAETLALDFALGDDLLDLREFVAEDLAGAAVDLRGTVAAARSAPRPDLAGEIRVDDPSRFLSAARDWLPGPVAIGPTDALREWAPLVLAGTATTEEETGAIALSLTGNAAASAVDLALRFPDGPVFGQALPFEGEASLRAERDPAAVLRQFGLSGLDLGLPAPLAVETQFQGSVGGDLAVTASATAPGSTGALDATVGLGGHGRGRFSIRAASDDASPWLTAAGLALGQGLDPLPVDVTGEVEVDGGSWSARSVRGTVAGASLAADLSAPLGEEVTGTVEVGELSLPWLATLVTGVPPEAGDGADGLWSALPFGRSLVGERTFALDVAAERLALADGVAAEAFDALVRGGRGRIAFEEASAIFRGGRVEGRAGLGNEGGFGALDLALQAQGVALAGRDGPVRGTLAGRIEAEGSGRDYRELLSTVAGEGEIRVTDAVFDDVASAGLAPILRASDAEGFNVDETAVLGLVGELGLDRQLRLPSLAVPITVRLGTLALGPAMVDDAQGEVRLEGSVDLRTGAREGRLLAAFLPAEDDRIEGSAPSVTYALGSERSGWTLADVSPLASFLAQRAAQREEERLQALREDLRETVRLRREARLARFNEAERERLAALEAARLEAERVERERRLAAEAAARDAEAERARAAAREAAAAELARQAAERAAVAREAAPTPAPVPSPVPPLDLDLPAPVLPPPVERYEGLPGVGPLSDF